jgi:hypothetical protein
MKKTTLIGTLILGWLASSAGHAQSAVASSPSTPLLYVDEFRPIAQSSGGFGPLHALASGMRAHRADENAAELSKDLVAALSAAHSTAHPLPPAAPLPKSGWLIRGVFYSLDEGGHLISIPFLSAKKSPNVEVTVTLADLSQNPDTPFAVIGTDSVLMGQGAPIGWNPYVVAARFVIHRAEGDRSLTGLADEIAQKIIANLSELSNHSKRPP